MLARIQQALKVPGLSLVVILTSACQPRQVSERPIDASDCSIAAGQSASNNSIKCSNLFIVTDENISKIIKSLYGENSNLRSDNISLKRDIIALKSQEKLTQAQLLLALGQAKLASDRGWSPAARFNYIVNQIHILEAQSSPAGTDTESEKLIRAIAATAIKNGDISNAQYELSKIDLSKRMYNGIGREPGLSSSTLLNIKTAWNSFKFFSLGFTPWKEEFEPPPKSLSADFWFKNQYGRWVNIKNDNKDVKIISFGQINSRCPSIFGSLLDAKLTFGRVYNIQSYYISLDFEKDTPAVLNKFSNENKIPIQILRGDERRIKYAARNLRAYYAKMDDGYYDHTSATYVFDRFGKFIGVFPMGAPGDDIKEKLEMAIYSTVEETRKRDRDTFDLAKIIYSEASASEGSKIISNTMSQAALDYEANYNNHKKSCEHAGGQ